MGFFSYKFGTSIEESHLPKYGITFNKKYGIYPLLVQKSNLLIKC